MKNLWNREGGKCFIATTRNAQNDSVTLRFSVVNFLLFFCLCQGVWAGAYVTYGMSGGRFGDQLLSYLHAKWISYEQGIPMLYIPFLYSSEMALDGAEERLGRGIYNSFKRVRVRSTTQFDPSSSLIYECPYFPAFADEQKSGGWSSYPVNWKDAGFRRVAMEMIRPKRAVQVIWPPGDAVSIAVHVREGGGFDTDHTRLYDPLKLPPLDFYVEALRKVLEMFEGQKIYCHVFTDALDTKAVAKRIEESGVSVMCRMENNRHDENVLEDFYSLFNFDIIIRPRSNYSIIPSLLKDYAIVCSPKEFKRTGTTIEITAVDIEKNNALCNALRLRR